MQLTYLLILAAGLVPELASGRALSRRAVACEFSVTPNSGDNCQSFTDVWSLTVDDLKMLNPGVTCPNLDTSQSYCLVGSVTDDPPITSTTQSSGTSTSKSNSTKTSTITRGPTTTSRSTIAPSTTTTTRSGNGVTTPIPTQSGMVGNCNKFHFVEKDETCDTIAALYSISATQFLKWNPAAKTDCSGLWASTYACVGIIGGTPPATTTKPGNGITTPTPVHPGMVNNCNKFAYVNPGDTCDELASLYHVSTANLVSWNAGIGGKDCRSLQANTFICIGIIGSKPTTTGNGIPTPTPTQSGMVSNCSKFVYVNPGDTCAGIASKNSISIDNFVKWNKGVGGKDCRGLQAYTYACIGVKG